MSQQSSLSGIVIILAAIVVMATLTQFGIFDIAQGQTNITSSLTPEQKAAICNPSDKTINSTESRICGVPVTVKPHVSSSNTTSALPTRRPTTSATRAAANTTTSENNTSPSIIPSIIP
ncbi:MAG TPA: hypothetical protein VE619_00760 [Nitrososphaeraceae archaeon]|nr:hypothetical protein [Nitrososphaeraceae archaeon]